MVFLKMSLDLLVWGKHTDHLSEQNYESTYSGINYVHMNPRMK